MNVCLYFCLNYPARKSHLFCAVIKCRLWPARSHHIFPHYLINGMIFGKKVVEYETSVLIYAAPSI